MSASKLAQWAALLCTYFIWGSTYLANRFCLESLPPFLTVAARFLVAGAVLITWRRLAGDAPPTPPQWRSSAVVGFFLLFGGSGFVIWAEQRVVSGIAALLVGSSPLWMILLDTLPIWKVSRAYRPNIVSATGVIAGFVGIAVLIAPIDLRQQVGQVDMLGAAVLTLAAILWAAGSLYGRSADMPVSPLLGTALEMLCGGGMLLLASFFAGEWSTINLSRISFRSLLGLAYLTIPGSIVAYSAYTWLLRVAPTHLVSTSAYVNPIVAILLGSLIAAEPLTPRVLISSIVIISSVALITVRSPTGSALIREPKAKGIEGHL